MNPLMCTEQQLNKTTFIALEFTIQKNGVWGELVGLGRSRHPTLWPVLAIIYCVKNLHLYNAPPTSPIYHYHNDSAWNWNNVNTTHLHWATSALANQTGVTADNSSIKSLQSSGDMALLFADVDLDKICLLGHWHSDEMLHYLPVQAFPVVTPLAPLMVCHRCFRLIPNNRLG
jgi:hypothetical protein